MSREKQNSVILLEGLFLVFSYVSLRWLCLLEKIINSSPDRVGLFCVKWSYSRLDFGNYLSIWDTSWS